MSAELDLFSVQPFDGDTIDHEQDHGRLAAQLLRVKSLMLDGRARTLAEIAAVTGYPEGSISARLRDLRKEKFGKYTVEKRRIGNGLFSYRVAA